MLTATRKHNCLSYKSEEYEVFHVKDHDYYCDLHIMACSFDNQEKILIPVDKNFMIENLSYFESMFKSGSNWEEGKIVNMNTENKNEAKTETETDTESQKKKFPAQITPVQVPTPKLLGEYIKSIYTEKLKIDKQNCADFHYIADYFQDECLLHQITFFVRENINFKNSVKLLRHSNKFEGEIERFYKENSLEDFEEFALEFNELNQGKFVKMMELLDGTVSSEEYIKILTTWVNSFEDPIDALDDLVYKINFQKVSIKERLKFYNYCVAKTRKRDQILELHEHILGIVTDADYDIMGEEVTYYEKNKHIKKLNEMIKNVSTDNSIEIQKSEDDKGLLIKKNDGNDWTTGKIIFPIEGITSFTVYNVTGSTGIMIGFTNHKNTLPNWEYPGGGENSSKWDRIIACDSGDGAIYYGSSKKSYENNKWNDKNDHITVKIINDKIEFETNSKNSSLKLRFDRKEYGVDGKLFPALAIHNEIKTVLLTDVKFE